MPVYVNYYYNDLLTADCPLIVHGCNDKGVMGSGVALAVKNKYPKAFKDYKEAWDYATDKSYIGTLFKNVIFSQQPDGKIIANAVTQKKFGRDPSTRYMSYDALDETMRKVASYCTMHNIKSVAMPKIGSGLGNASWEINLAIITEAFSNSTVETIKVYIQ